MKMTTDEFGELLLRIEVGELDDRVETLQHVLRERRQMVNRRRGMALTVGDRAQIASNSRPQYIRGLAGEVIRVQGDKLHLRLDPLDAMRAGRYARPGPDGQRNVVIAPVSIVEPEA